MAKLWKKANPTSLPRVAHSETASKKIQNVIQESPSSSSLELSLPEKRGFKKLLVGVESGQKVYEYRFRSCLMLCSRPVRRLQGAMHLCANIHTTIVELRCLPTQTMPMYISELWACLSVFCRSWLVRRQLGTYYALRCILNHGAACGNKKWRMRWRLPKR